MTSKDERNMYEDLLSGRCIAGQYKNSNLFIAGRSNAQTIEERSEKKFSLPLNLNSDYLQLCKPQQQKKKIKVDSEHLVDPKILRKIR